MVNFKEENPEREEFIDKIYEETIDTEGDISKETLRKVWDAGQLYSMKLMIKLDRELNKNLGHRE